MKWFHQMGYASRLFDLELKFGYAQTYKQKEVIEWMQTTFFDRLLKTLDNKFGRIDVWE